MSDSLLGVEPPRDANGKVIPFDTEILYGNNGLVFYVSDFRYSTKAKEWFANVQMAKVALNVRRRLRETALEARSPTSQTASRG